MRKDIPVAAEPFCAFQTPGFLCGIEVSFVMNAPENAFHVLSTLSHNGADVHVLYRAVEVLNTPTLHDGGFLLRACFSSNDDMR